MHHTDKMKPKFEKTNIFNLLLNDINKTHGGVQIQIDSYVQVFAQG